MFKRLLNQRKAGQVFTGDVCYTFERALVPFPGFYATRITKKGACLVDKNLPVTWDKEKNHWIYSKVGENGG